MEKNENELINLLNTYREESLEFKEKYFSALDKIKEIEAELQQSQDRERVLREALEVIEKQSKESIDTAFIYNVHNYINELKLIHITAREALEASK